MPDLFEPKYIKERAEKYGFQFKKSLGQNFLINPTVCPKMAQAALEDEVEGVIEIGPGFGVLTSQLAKYAKKVVAVELDNRIPQVLAETLSEYDNVEIILEDAMKCDFHTLIKEKFAGMKVAVCANLPYYITSPIIMRLLEEKLPVESIVVMVQKEAADRICAKLGSRESGAVTVAVNYYSQPEKLFGVSKGSFLPAPKVDSSVIKLNIRKEPPVKLLDEKFYFSVVKAAFAQRRKTFVNALSSGCNIKKEVIVNVLESLGIQPDIRAEKLTDLQLADISNKLKHNINESQQ